MKLFFDAEFTGLHQHTTLISIGFVTELGHTFYAEFTDYDGSQVDDWLEENIFNNLKMQNFSKYLSDDMFEFEVKDNSEIITNSFLDWLNQLKEAHSVEKFEIWSDCLAYDWVLFCELFNGALNVPDYIYYIPFDICTLFKLKGLDADTDRQEFAGMKGKQHNALYDAKVIKKCYEVLTA